MREAAVIEDLFFKRYPRRISRAVNDVDHSVAKVLAQGAHIFYDDVEWRVEFGCPFYERIERQVSRELGRYIFDSRARNSAQRCLWILTQTYDHFSDRWGSPDELVKIQISLLELLFRYAEQEVARGKMALRGVNAPSVLKEAIDELNARFREAGVPLHYHGGVIQFADNDLTQARIAEPFWRLIADPKWANVEHDMKEAVDRADNNVADAPFYALKALESTIKIISDEKGWTTGREAGAINYVERMGGKQAGHFIAQWEVDALKVILGSGRLGYAHGAGSGAPPNLSHDQTQWVIESCMSWIKSLVRRM